MKKILVTVSLIAVSTMKQVSAEPPLTPLDMRQVAYVETLLLPHTTGYGLPISNRGVWDRLFEIPNNTKVIASAERLAKEPFPIWNDSVMFEYERTGIRVNADKMMGRRSSRLSTLVIAECLENKGRFITPIDRTLNELCTQPTWVLVAHDPNLDNFWGRVHHVDLAAASMADDIAQAIYLVGEKLNPTTLQRVKEVLQERIFDPVLYSYRTLDCMGTKQSWITRDNNWNLVCVAGVTCAALAVIDDIKLRAEFVAAANKYIQYGVNGFLEDGYCPEGIGYYNYGFSYFIRLREGIYRATSGRLDLYANPRVAKIATFGPRSEIINGVYPAITDCRINTVPSRWISWYSANAYDWSKDEKEVISFSSTPSLTFDLITAFSDAPCENVAVAEDTQIGLRSYFDKADVLTCRPYQNDWNNALGVCIKGGSNDESHNHNDVGSYTIVAGNELMMGDMGGPTAYTSKTFSDERYTLYPSFSSYGHPLPMFDNQQQKAGHETKCKVLLKKFRDDRDYISYDISDAYGLNNLKKVTRTFNYNRKEHGAFTVIDQFEAKEKLLFETAITTRQKVEVTDNKIYLIGKNNKIEITITAPIPFSITQTTIADYAFTPFTRIGIRFNSTLKAGEIKLQYVLIEPV